MGKGQLCVSGGKIRFAGILVEAHLDNATGG